MPPRSKRELTPSDPLEQPAAQKQHPALEGEPQQEVAQRTSAEGDATTGAADTYTEPSDQFEHTFVMANGHFERDHPAHLDNIRATLEAAIQRGLHPKGEPTLASLSFEDPDRSNRYTPSTHATYRVQVTPAIVDDAESNVLTTVTPGNLGKEIET